MSIDLSGLNGNKSERGFILYEIGMGLFVTEALQSSALPVFGGIEPINVS